MSWELPEALGRFQGPRDAPGVRESKVVARGASWELPETPGMCQGPRNAHGASGASWGLPETPGRFQGPRDARGARGSKLRARGASWDLPEGVCPPLDPPLTHALLPSSPPPSLPARSPTSHLVKLSQPDFILSIDKFLQETWKHQYNEMEDLPGHFRLI